MGNSYINRGTVKFPLTEIHYDAGNGWKVIQVKGKKFVTVKGG
jgi:hypothetical protein